MRKLKQLQQVARRRRFYATGHADGKLLELKIAAAQRRPRGSLARKKLAARIRRLRRIAPGDLRAGGGLIR